MVEGAIFRDYTETINFESFGPIFRRIPQGKFIHVIVSKLQVNLQDEIDRFSLKESLDRLFNPHNL